MNSLQVIKHDGVDVVDSRAVAEMTGKRHDHLIRDIKNYCNVLARNNAPKFGLVDSSVTAPKSGVSATELKIELSDFFIDSTYTDATGRELPCYLLTKKGCDMVANKMTGEKGVLFTAAYVTAFEAMREHIETGKPLPKSRKTEQELAAADKRATAMMLNAKCRTANQLMALWNKAGVKAEYQALALGDLYADDGIHLPRIALQGTKVTYDKGTIAEKLGVYSKSGKPHAQLIGAIIKLLDISDDEREAVPYHHNGHDGTDYQYTESVIDKVGTWLCESGHPTPIRIDGKNYQVKYSEGHIDE